MRSAGSPLGLHRVVEPLGVLPQAAWRLDADPEIRSNEARISIERLNLDAASFRSLLERSERDPGRVRAEVVEIVETRGKMHNPVTGSGGMLIGTVDEVGPEHPHGLVVGQRVATLVSLTLTPLLLTDGLRDWSGVSEQVPATGSAIVFERTIVAALPDDLPPELALAVLDVCGASALAARLTRRKEHASVAVIGAAGKSGSLSLAAATDAGAHRLIALVRDDGEAGALNRSGLADAIVVCDATDAVAVGEAIHGANGGRGADITIVCVDVPGAEHGAILATRDGGTVVYFSMATSFSQAALGAEGLAADVTMLVGNGYTPGHAAYALDLVRKTPALRAHLEQRIAGHA